MTEFNGNRIYGKHSRVYSSPYSKRHRAYSVVYLVILVLYLFRPVIPYFEYAINKKYIAEHLCINKDVPGNCCQGKCYLHEQLKKNLVPADTEKEDGRKYVHDRNTDDHLKTDQFSTTQYSLNISLVDYFSPSKSDTFLSLVFVPPEI